MQLWSLFQILSKKDFRWREKMINFTPNLLRATFISYVSLHNLWRMFYKVERGMEPVIMVEILCSKTRVQTIKIEEMSIVRLSVLKLKEIKLWIA